MDSMVNMIKITKTLTVACILCSFCLLAGCATTNKLAQGPLPPKTPSQTMERPDGGLAPVAEAPQSGSWGGNFLLR